MEISAETTLSEFSSFLHAKEKAYVGLGGVSRLEFGGIERVGYVSLRAACELEAIYQCIKGQKGIMLFLYQ